MPLRKATKASARPLHLTEPEQAWVRIATNSHYLRGSFTEGKLDDAILLHREKRILLPLAFEIEGFGVARDILRYKGVLRFVQRLKEVYEIKTKHAAFTVSPSFLTRTSASTKYPTYFGLNNFSQLSFRVLPAASEVGLYKDRLGPMTKRDPYRSAIIVEMGIALVGGRPVVVITNAQATRDYYSLPWALKKRFDGVYEKTLNIIREASGVPVLVPTNATVNGYLQGALGHRVSDGVLNEFYDRFCEKRGKKKVKVEIKHPSTGRKITLEFWRNHS